MFNAVKKFFTKAVFSTKSRFETPKVIELETTLPPAENYLQSEVIVEQPEIKQPKIKQLRQQLNTNNKSN